MKRDKLREIFFAEAEELLEDLENDLVRLENAPQDEGLINSIFRAAHTVKGSAGVAGLESVYEFVHKVEDVLSRVREGELPVTVKLISIFLEAVDITKNLLEAERSGEEPDKTALEKFSRRLKRFQPVTKVEEAPVPEPESITAAAEPDEFKYYRVEMLMSGKVFECGQDPLMLLLELKELGEFVKVSTDLSRVPDFTEIDLYDLYLSPSLVLKTNQPLSSIKNVFLFVEDDHQINIDDVTDKFKNGVDILAADKSLGELLVEQGVVQEDDVTTALEAQKRTGELLVEKGFASPKEVGKVLEIQKKSRDLRSAQTIRVKTEKLDRLVDLVGETLIGISALNQYITAGRQEETGGNKKMPDGFEKTVEELTRTSRDLQEQIMQVRMVSIEGVFNRYDRFVRDYGYKQGKQIVLVKTGSDTELDKNVIEQINDPIKHLIRNAVDHGLESSDERVKTGKPEKGTLRLKAYQQEGKICIEVSDDGRGIEPRKILNKAIERGLASREKNYTNDEIYKFMFLPGFSTAKTITDISGRGVGLDVVKKNVANLRGMVELFSEVGKSTTFRIRLPLTLAILDGMKVQVCSEIMTIPLLSIIESLRPAEKDVKTIEGMGEVINFRGEYIPLIRLNELFKINEERMNPLESLVVVVESNTRKLGLLVNDVLGHHQAVIKSLDKNLKRVAGTTGVTILGNGTVSLIVDIFDVEQLAFA
ncbi:MAG: chemotaxis protein CheA [bacterium]